MSDRLTAYFLAYDDPVGWEAFRTDPGRTSFGFTEHREAAAARVRPGDILLCYLKGPSAWSGALKVVSGKSSDSTPQESLRNYPVRLPIERMIMLPSYKAIPIFEPEVWNSLSRTRELVPRSQGWIAKAGLRGDLTQLSEADGRLILDALMVVTSGPLPAGAAMIGDFDPQGVVADLERAERQVVVRRGQQAFRNELMEAYQGRCAISGCDVLDVLEAAHITPHLGKQTNRSDNGLLLRADLHTLWDCRLLMVDPNSRRVVLNPRLRASSYGVFEGVQLPRPAGGASAPSTAALLHHWKVCQGGLS